MSKKIAPPAAEAPILQYVWPRHLVIASFFASYPHLNPPRNNHTNTAKMGRVRTKTVKKSAKVIIERYYPRLTLDFEANKRICDEIAIIASKRLRNKVSSCCWLPR